jgi:ribonuclease VapC
MIVDASAYLAMALREPDADDFIVAMASNSCRMSVVSYFEVALRLDRLPPEQGGADLDAKIARLGIVLEPVSVEQAQVARAASQRYGKGSGHPARLNLGDCFSYALAKTRGEPLLFKGTDFSRTDIATARPS